MSSLDYKEQMLGASIVCLGRRSMDAIRGEIKDQYDEEEGRGRSTKYVHMSKEELAGALD
jgi:hypothetical protein